LAWPCYSPCGSASTTAANIWLCGAVGLACGAGHYVIAAITFGFTVAIVSGMYLLERWLSSEI